MKHIVDATILIFILTFVVMACGKLFMGPAGKDGSSCSVISLPVQTNAPNGGTLITCTDGTQSMVLNGSDGVNGLNGSPGTTITAVQLCPTSYVPTYPTVFPEVAFCFSGELWGVYSANGGFMTLLTPGRYSSNGIGASCTFSITSNCRVTQ